MQDSERARALEQALRELTAMVRGECPSLLNEDSGGNGDLSCQIEKLLAVDPPPSGAIPQATGGYIHHSLTDWIPTPECDCDRCTSARKSARKPTGGASPQADATCEHGTAMDVHCCNCHSGFIFDMNHECPSPELTWREAVEQALGVENDPENHTPSWAFDVVRAAREIGNAPTPASPQADTVANVRALTVHICEDCLNLRGEMCNEPGCRFCRRTMAEVAEYLDVLLIRPRIDGVSVLIDEGALLTNCGRSDV